MAWDFAIETVRVLNKGLHDPPSPPVPGVTFPAAMHRGERVGAVLFLRLWRNGQWDSDAAIASRENDDWLEPWSCGGGGWPNPYERPAQGWDGKALAMISELQQDASGSDRSAAAVCGMAAKSVVAIRCTTPTATFRYDLSPLGAFVVVVEGQELPTLTPLDARGSPLEPPAP